MLPFGGPADDEPKPRTRCGYAPHECLRSFERSLALAGPIEMGRALHFAADVVCSGGFEAFARSLWEYATAHIGLASPRVFVYLKKRVDEIEAILRRLPDETAYNQEEFQVRVGELVLVLREAPTRAALAWPKVGPETHTDAWVLTLGVKPETAALRRVWRPEGDLGILRTAGAEICAAIAEGSTERALFWVKWLFEEEAAAKKAMKGATLTSIDRSDGIGGPKANKSGAGFFLMALYSEIYRELAEKGLVRMNEEFRMLVDLWKGAVGGAAAGTASTKKAILGILTQILCEVPRWKVPAAPTLVRDPVAMSQAIRQVPRFFREVISYDAPRHQQALVKAFRARGGGGPKGGATAGAKKGEAAATSKMEAFDAALEAYFARS